RLRKGCPPPGPEHFQAGRAGAGDLLRAPDSGALSGRESGAGREARIWQGQPDGEGQNLPALRDAPDETAGLEFAWGKVDTPAEGIQAGGDYGEFGLRCDRE